MQVIRFSLSLLLTLALIYILDTNWNFNNKPIPALGKFIDPFHGFWQNIEDESSYADDAFEIPGLQSAVSVVYDSLLIPHIFAQNESDLYFAQGYITARHRLWQMEFMIHAAAGRVSEIIGEAALDYDRRQRRLGMVYGAEHAIESMMKDPQAEKIILQYTAGINRYIESLPDADLPFEYKLLNYRPEPWTPLKMGLLLKSFSQTLSIHENDLEMTNALKIFGKEITDILYADLEKSAGDPIVSNPGGWKFSPLKLDSIPLALPDELINVTPITNKQKGIGSNNWAVSGSKTATGSPILCNDPHLNLSFPSLWYAVHLHCPGLNVMGASLPGAPGVIVGFNDSIAWAVTNAQRDLVDWYKIDYQTEQKDAYKSDSNWLPTRKRIEKIVIRGKDPFYDTVIYTHHGPVVYDNRFHGESEKNGYAFRWLAHDGSQELTTLYLLNHAQNYNDYRQALTYWSGPAQNFAFASVAGDIAMNVQGKFPVRRKGEGKYVLDGTSTHTEWKAFIPFEQNIMSKNPARGFVSSANQFPADSTYPYYIHAYSFETYRNRRINEVLSANDTLTPVSMMKLQNDNYNLQAAESLPLLLSMLDLSSLAPNESRIAVALTNWDFYNEVTSFPASYYEAWWITLMAMLWDEINTAEVPLEYPQDFNTIYLMKNKPDFPLFDIQSTPEKEDLKTVVRKSFVQSVKRVEEWEKKNGKPAQWADYKDTYIQHLLRVEALGEHVRVGGNASIVNAAGPRSGPSWRMIVSLEKPQIKAWGVYPAGQSGNPGSAFYNNLLEAWAEGRYYKLNFVQSPDALVGKNIGTANLTPAEK